jgi:hypothetical protein
MKKVLICLTAVKMFFKKELKSNKIRMMMKIKKIKNSQKPN